MKNNHIPCSVGVLTFNSEKTLPQALESLKDFDEIILCDGGSTDNTLLIAQHYSAKIIKQDAQYKNQNNTISDFSGVRNQMLDIAKHGWFLFVDSDEFLSKEAAHEIEEISKQPITEKSTLAFWIPRKRVYEGKVVECTTTYPNYQMRFFHKSGVTKFIKKVHERIEVLPSTNIGYLKNCEFVPFEFTYDAWKKKLSYYIDIEVVRHQDQPFSQWLQVVYRSTKVSLLYFLRHVRIIFFCHGHRMPLWYEMLQHWYHWKLITQTGKKYFFKGNALK